MLLLNDASFLQRTRLLQIANNKWGWERMKLVIEPSAAVAVAAAMQHECLKGMRVGVLLSGGNVDLGKLPFS